jgi:predicted nucleic acid-binding protein
MTIPTKFKLALFALLFSVAANAQMQERFIEVSVSDSIHLVPAQYVYEISSGEDAKLANFFGPDGQENADPDALNRVEGILKTNQFTFQVQDRNDYTLSKSNKPKNAIVVTLANRQDLEKLYTLLKDFKGISGKITQLVPGKTNFKDLLFKKLYEKAKAEATALATVSGNQLGKLISANETKSAMDGYAEMMQQTMKAMPFNLGNTNSPTDFVYERQFQFRFKLE